MEKLMTTNATLSINFESGKITYAVTWIDDYFIEGEDIGESEYPSLSQKIEDAFDRCEFPIMEVVLNEKPTVISQVEFVAETQTLYPMKSLKNAKKNALAIKKSLK